MKKLFTFRTLLLTALLWALGVEGAYAQYCIPTYSTGCSSGDNIDDVILAGDVAPGINNLNTPCAAGSYSDYTDMSATLTIGNSYSGNVTTGYDFNSEDVRIWIDYNDNEVFESSEQIATLDDLSNTSTGLFNFTVPISALPGTYRMRVRMVYGTTASTIDPCNSASWGECHDYSVVLAAAIDCSDPSYAFPASATTIADPLSICTSGEVNLSIATVTPMDPAAGVTYQWQTSPNATGPWTDLGTAGNSPNYTATISASAYFRCVVMCEGAPSGLVSSASDQVVVNNPGTATGTDGSRCGPGSVALSATGPSGTTLRWYANQTGGTPLYIGPNFMTPYITETTDFWVSAGTPPAAGSATIGAGALVPSSGDYVTIFSGGWGGYKHQFLIRAEELIDMGMVPGAIINSISVDNSSGTFTYNGFKLGLKNTTSTTMGAFEAGVVPAMDEVNYETVVGINTFTLDYPFTWDGSNLIIETCWSNNSTSNTYSYLKYDNTTYVSTRYRYMDNAAPAAVCADMSGSASVSRRPQFIINYDGSCQGPRTEVTATVNPNTLVTYTFDSVLCNDAVTPISISSTVSTYPSYNWAPSDYLFTNAAGTTPYTGGNASTVYFRSDVSGPHEVYLMAGDPTLTTGCTYADTLTIWVQPGNISLNAMPDTICVSGSSELSLVPDTNYYPGTIQWQESADGVAYTDIAGANDVSYTTPELSDEYYYKVIVSEGNGVCTELTKHLLIADPQLLDRSDSFNCGPGTVMLQAEASLNTGLFWYENETGGTPVGTGTPFETPYLLETDTFWVAAGVGGSSTEPTWIGSGTGTTGSNPNPFYTTYYANKTQFLITADELTAAGYTAGAIQSIGFDVLGVTTTLALTNFTITMGLTTSTTLNTASWEAASEVYTNAAYTVQPNTVNEFVLTNPFPWDGVSNLVIGTCFANTGWNGTQTIRYTTGFSFNASHYHYADDANHCTTQSGSLNYTSTSRPNILFDIVSGCESPREPVIAYIHPDPVVDLGDDINTCVDSGTLVVLDAGLQPNSPVFEWDNGSTSQVRAVGESGTYSVSVTNQWGCSSGDTIDIILRENPNVDLGNDTSVCNGVTITLDAGEDGIEYFWNTGATTKTIEVNSGGQYNVFVTNEDGCVGMDTVVVNMSGELPTIQGIDIDNNGAFTFTFSAINPQNVIGYEWDFGDGSPLSYMDSPVHTYPGTGNYIVTLKLASSCGFYSDSTSTHIVSVNKVNVDENALTVYPNPASESATIISRGGLKLEQVAMYNVLGQLIQSAEVDNKEQHTLKLTGLASGVYTLQIQTDKGVVTRKLEIIK